MKHFEAHLNRCLLFLIIIMIAKSMVLFISCKPRSDRVFYPVEDSLMEMDKKVIAKKFVDNVEYFRKYHIFNKQDYTKEELENHYKIYPCAEYDPSGFYIGYASRQKIGNG